MRAAIAYIRKELNGIYSSEETDSLIFLIFEKLKGYSRTQFLLSKEELLSGDEFSKVQQIIQRLRDHEPIQYILGETFFYGLPFYTSPGVLIPRPETEELVEWIIQERKPENPIILDIGTGSGCIAVALSKNIPEARVVACDISPVCLEIASRNAQLNQTAIEVVALDILHVPQAVSLPKFDIIVSNPPYVRLSEKSRMERNVLDYEPVLALFVTDENSLLFYERIADFALENLNRAGQLFFEINEAFGTECLQMLRMKGFSEIILKQDIHGKDRMIRAVLVDKGTRKV